MLGKLVTWEETNKNLKLLYGKYFQLIEVKWNAKLH